MFRAHAVVFSCALNMNMLTSRGKAGQQESRQNSRKKYTKQVDLLGILKPIASSSCQAFDSTTSCLQPTKALVQCEHLCLGTAGWSGQRNTE